MMKNLLTLKKGDRSMWFGNWLIKNYGFELLYVLWVILFISLWVVGFVLNNSVLFFMGFGVLISGIAVFLLTMLLTKYNEYKKTKQGGY